ncbi:profilin-4 isoform X2 [Amblyraja radiata]|uniref:profilin-4 isoform X2 n=1 Tax=Amblyraja radiata TaxID=386614 RepID=UPI001402C89E|nr:profilin-4 isoform X2 [Amblyraja radiata]
MEKLKLGEYQDLLTQALIATNHVQDCAIIDVKNHSMMLASRGFKLDAEEIQAFLNAFTQADVIREYGLLFKTINYTCVRADRSSIYGKNNNEGLVLVKTEMYIICATYTRGMYPSVCVEAVEKLGDYFKSKGK